MNENILAGITGVVLGLLVAGIMQAINFARARNKVCKAAIEKEAALKELKQAIRDFLDENQLEYIFESKLRLRLLNIFFPAISQSIAQLLYGMYHLRKLLVKLNKDTASQISQSNKTM